VGLLLSSRVLVATQDTGYPQVAAWSSCVMAVELGRERPQRVSVTTPMVQLATDLLGLSEGKAAGAPPPTT